MAVVVIRLKGRTTNTEVFGKRPWFHTGTTSTTKIVSGVQLATTFAAVIRSHDAIIFNIRCSIDFILG